MSTRRELGAAIVAAAGYLVVAAITVVKPQPSDHWNAAGRALEAAFIVGLVGSAIAIEGVRRHIVRGAFGTRSARVAQIGFTAMAVSSVASLVKGGDTLGPVFLLGVLATLVGLLLLGVAGLREGLAARWVPVVPFVTMLVGIALADHGGCAVIAAGWLALARVMSGSANHRLAAPATA